MENCLFCKMAAGEIPVKLVYEDEKIIAFHDIDPQAPVHFLIIPKEHITSPAHITPECAAVVGHIFAVIAQIVAKQGLANGYRVVTNCGADGGQSVPHLHFHVLGKRKLAWPPG